MALGNHVSQNPKLPFLKDAKAGPAEQLHEVF